MGLVEQKVLMVQLVGPILQAQGGGIANPVFAQRIKEGDRSKDKPESSPRIVIEQFYGKAPFQPDCLEDLLDSLLQMQIGDQFYPGDYLASPNFPFVRPGKFGPINAASPAYQQKTLAALKLQKDIPPTCWMRGFHDQIVSDQSLFDLGTLGQMGLIEQYPGEEIYPSQPMVSQTRAMLKHLQKQGGYFKEIVFEESGHSPFLEEKERFVIELSSFIQQI